MEPNPPRSALNELVQTPVADDHGWGSLAVWELESFEQEVPVGGVCAADGGCLDAGSLDSQERDAGHGDGA